jgi:hypothetical protein
MSTRAEDYYSEARHRRSELGRPVLPQVHRIRSLRRFRQRPIAEDLPPDRPLAARSVLTTPKKVPAHTTTSARPRRLSGGRSFIQQHRDAPRRRPRDGNTRVVAKKAATTRKANADEAAAKREATAKKAAATRKKTAGACDQATQARHAAAVKAAATRKKNAGGRLVLPPSSTSVRRGGRDIGSRARCELPRCATDSIASRFSSMMSFSDGWAGADRCPRSTWQATSIAFSSSRVGQTTNPGSSDLVLRHLHDATAVDDGIQRCLRPARRTGLAQACRGVSGTYDLDGDGRQIALLQISISPFGRSMLRPEAPEWTRPRAMDATRESTAGRGGCGRPHSIRSRHESSRPSRTR